MPTKSFRLDIPSHIGYKVPGVFHTSLEGIERPHPRRIAVMLHGIFSNKDEKGRFIRLADKLVASGCDVLRVDYQGHGDHPVRDKESTISGMVIDVASVLEYCRDLSALEPSVIASSFGGGLALLYLQTPRPANLHRVVLLNPVIDYHATLLDAKLQWGQSLFSDNGYQELASTGFITLEVGYKMSLNAVFEMALMKPYKAFDTLTIPTLLIHGDQDSKVPYVISELASERSDYVSFKGIRGAEHAFKTPEHEEITHSLSVKWISSGRDDNESY